MLFEGWKSRDHSEYTLFPASYSDEQKRTVLGPGVHDRIWIYDTTSHDPQHAWTEVKEKWSHFLDEIDP